MCVEWIDGGGGIGWIRVNKENENFIKKLPLHLREFFV